VRSNLKDDSITVKEPVFFSICVEVRNSPRPSGCIEGFDRTIAESTDTGLDQLGIGLRLISEDAAPGDGITEKQDSRERTVRCATERFAPLVVIIDDDAIGESRQRLVVLEDVADPVVSAHERGRAEPKNDAETDF
jgi:hypothetical protein